MNVGTPVRHALKRTLKSGVGLIGQMTPQDPDRSLILTYHSVGTHRHEMTVTASAFRDQMAWLAEHTNVTPLDRAVRGQPGVAITFDDGYRNNLTIAAPILDTHRFPATVFMVSGRAGATLDGEGDTDGGALMDWEELRAWEAMGLEVGSHTVTHPRLATLAAVQQQAEISDSKKRIEAELGHAIHHFAYPYGSARDYDQVSAELAQIAGYRAAVSNRYGTNRPGDAPWELRRIWIDATDDLPTFAAKVTGHLDALRALDSPAGILARRITNRILRIR